MGESARRRAYGPDFCKRNYGYGKRSKAKQMKNYCADEQS